MIVEQHYDDETLISFLDSQDEPLSSDAHLQSCDSCAELLDDYRATTEVMMHAADVWDSRVLESEPSRQTIEVLRAFADRTAAENAAAETHLAELLAGPHDQWKARLNASPELRTAGMVRALIGRMDGLIAANPADAAGVIALAVDIAESLDPAAYAGDTVVKLRGAAWHERAYALSQTGDVRNAMEALSTAEAHFSAAKVADYEIARLRIMRSALLGAADEHDESLREVRRARPTFEAFGDSRRLLTVRMGEASALYRARDFRAALSGFLDVEHELPPDDAERPGLMHNIGVCYRELREFDNAMEWYRRAVDAFTAMGATAHMSRARWYIGRTLLAQQRWPDAESVLRSVIVRFAELGMREEVILATLDLSEVLLVSDRQEEVAVLCQSVVEELKRSQLAQTERALLAVSYLQETLARRRATTSLVMHVRDYVERVHREPALLFAPPPV